MRDVNLIPADVLARRQQRARLRLWGIAVAVALLALLGSGFLLHWQIGHAEQRLARLQQQRQALAQLLEDLKALRARQQQLQVRERVLERLLQRVSLPRLFADLAALTDAQLWLTRVELRTAASPAPAVAPQRAATFFTLGRTPAQAADTGPERKETQTSLLVQGYATSTQRLADFLAGLARLPWLAGLELQVVRQGVFLTREAVEFTLAVRL
ncbi:MAG: hypothetical protein KatS3mg131_0119 [Candidatus Tectimicrobiota bacterium]|nr:MAG: hypothetical protein KatS3mg131_0119 [Candidatus Tectomicrobia bacterium]